MIEFVAAYQQVTPLRSARSGRSRSCCGSRWSKSCAGSPTASSTARRSRERGAQVGAAAAERSSGRERARSTAARRRRRRERHAVERPSSSSCCSGCAISRRARRRPGWRCSARSRRRTTRRGDAAGRASARSLGPARDRQRHHQHAADVGDRLAAVLRSGQPGRAHPPRRSGGRVRRRWTSRRAIATATRSRSWRKARRQPETGGRARGRSSWPARPRARRSAQRSAASRRLLPDLARPVHARGATSLSAELRERLARFFFRIRRSAISG